VHDAQAGLAPLHGA